MEYLNAFYMLSTRRTIGFSSENPISMADIIAYLQVYPTDDVDLFMHLISQMDIEYITTKYGGSSGKTDNG